MADFTEKPWNGSAARYEDAGAYCDACLVNENTGPRSSWTKGACKLPVKEPTGEYNKNAMASAAGVLHGAMGGLKEVPVAARKAAARKLVSLYNQAKMDVPDFLKQMAG